MISANGPSTFLDSVRGVPVVHGVAIVPASLWVTLSELVEKHSTPPQSIIPDPAPCPTAIDILKSSHDLNWVETSDLRELTMLVDGRRAGGLGVWTDNKTGEFCWITAVLVAPVVGDPDIELRNIFQDMDEAKEVLASTYLSTATCK